MNLVTDNCLFPAETEEISFRVNMFVVLGVRYTKTSAAAPVVRWLHFLVSVLIFDNDWTRPFPTESEEVRP